MDNKLIFALLGVFFIFLLFRPDKTYKPSQEEIQSDYVDITKSINDYPYPQISRTFKRLSHGKPIIPLNNEDEILPKGEDNLVLIRNDDNVKTRMYLPDYYRKDSRGVGGKKILILGTGNIGTKIAIRLLESGGNIFLFRRNKKKLQKINEVLNIIKPKYTKSRSNIINSNQLKFENYDAIIGCSDNKIKFKIIKKLVKKPLIIDVGKGVFLQSDLNQLNKKNIHIFRLDIENSLSSFIDTSINTESFFENSFIKKKNKFRLVKKGILGNSGDIIVDDVIKPKRIIGVCSKDGLLENISTKKYKLLKKEIINK